MHQPHRVGQDHGKGSHRNHISSGTPTSLRARKTLLVATSRYFFRYHSPPAQSNGRGRGTRSRFSHFFYFYLFLFFYLSNISKIQWTKFEEKRIFGGRWVFDIVSGSTQENSGCAPAVPRPPPPIPNTWRSSWYHPYEHQAH